MMAALVVFGVNVLLMMGLWLLLRDALRDAYRDHFFDIRDDMRQWFLDHGYSLDRQEYAALRDLLNAYLRVSHRMRFSGYMEFVTQLDRLPDLQAELERRTEAMFATDDEVIRQESRRVRTAAAAAMLDYMVLSSPFVVMAVVVYGLCQLARHWTLTVPSEIVQAAMRLAKPVNSLDVIEDFSLLGGSRPAEA